MKGLIFAVAVIAAVCWSRHNAVHDITSFACSTFAASFYDSLHNWYGCNAKVDDKDYLYTNCLRGAEGE